MEFVREKHTEERAFFGAKDISVSECTFDEGESPFKECENVRIKDSMFRWKYPIWYGKNIKVSGSTWYEMARAGVWYVDGISVEDAVIQAPKNFRRCRDVELNKVFFPNAAETLWSCTKVKLSEVTAKGDYFAMNSSDMEISGLSLSGNYSFDGVKNVVVRDSKLISKDAFWNSEDVTVYDSFISGEYLGWNSKRLTFIGCTIESLQGMCYIDELVMKDCRLIDTTLAFEYSNFDAEIKGGVDSVLNPGSGRIRADHIGELIIQKDRCDPSKTVIICDDIRSQTDEIRWK